MHKIFFAIALLVSLVCINPIASAQTVTFSTDAGDIVVELLTDEVPDSVANFLGYVDRGDYDNTIFHRSVRTDIDGDMIPDFSVIQGGGFNLNGSQIPTGNAIENEFMSSNVRGTLAYARGSEIDSATSQFYFNVTDNVFLDTQNEGFTVFGEVISGLDVVDAINDFQIVDVSDPDDPNDPNAAFDELPVEDSFDGVTVFTQDLVAINSVTVASVPEPSSLLLLSGSAMLLLTKRRRS